jgi:ribonuclease D
MIRMNLYDYLKEELARGGLWEWAKDRPYREVIVKPEVIFAHERAWKRLQEQEAAKHE